MFITFEGVDGSGKTTQAKMLHEYLLSNKIDSVLTKEPGGGSDFSKDLRELLANSDSLLLSELFAIYAARNEHLEKLIWPKLQENCFVICDRFVDSSIVCYAKTMDEIADAEKKIETLNSLIRYRQPNITFYLNVSTENAFARIKERGLHDKYDNMPEKRMQLMIDMYKYLMNKHKRIIAIDANQSKDKIFQDILNYLQNNKVI